MMFHGRAKGPHVDRCENNGAFTSREGSRLGPFHRVGLLFNGRREKPQPMHKSSTDVGESRPLRFRHCFSHFMSQKTTGSRNVLDLWHTFRIIFKIDTVRVACTNSVHTDALQIPQVILIAPKQLLRIEQNNALPGREPSGEKESHELRTRGRQDLHRNRGKQANETELQLARACSSGQILVNCDEPHVKTKKALHPVLRGRTWLMWQLPLAQQVTTH